MCVSDPNLLFVYGTLRRGCDGAEARRLSTEGEWLGQARLRGLLYRVDWYPALVMDADEMGWVIGDLFRMTDPATILAWLDRYEECGPDFPEPQEYRRVIAEALASRGIQVAARDLEDRPPPRRRGGGGRS